MEKILVKFGMNNVNLVNIPLASQFNLSSSLCPSSREENDDMSRVPYSSIVGSLMYEMVCTRLDISHHVVGVVSRYMVNPRREN